MRRIQPVDDRALYCRGRNEGNVLRNVYMLVSFSQLDIIVSHPPSATDLSVFRLGALTILVEELGPEVGA